MMMISEVHAAQQLSGFCVTMMILIIIIILHMERDTVLARDNILKCISYKRDRDLYRIKHHLREFKETTWS